MHRALRVSSLGALLLLGATPVNAARAAHPRAAPALGPGRTGAWIAPPAGAGGIAVDVGGVLDRDDAQALEVQLRHELTGRIETFERLEADVGALEVVVTVREPSPTEFTGTLQLRSLGGDWRSTPVECTTCTTRELVTAVGSAASRLLAELGRDAPTGADPGADRSGAPASAGSSGTDAGEAAGPRSRRLIVAGGALGGVGLASVVVGAVLVGRPDRIVGGDPIERSSTRPPGWAAVGVGSAMLIGGAIMIGLGAQRRSKATKVAIDAVGPGWSGGWSLGVAGRF